MSDKPARINAIIEELRGTCKADYEVLTEEERDDKEILQAIDQELFLCSRCDWWCEHCETSMQCEDSTEPYCEDCED